MGKGASLLPDLSFETKAWDQGYKLVAGVDEAGRGPWAGPVVAGAVILDQTCVPNGLNDSKKLSEIKREHLFEELKSCSQIGVGIANVERIDRDNILAATMWAMGEALRKLPEYPDYALVDGNRAPAIPCAAETIVQGDSRSLSIAAASIVAKVTRDRLLVAFDDKYPGYGFARHKGYGTAQHRSALAELGPCPEHRTSFAPIRTLLEQRAAGDR